MAFEKKPSEKKPEEQSKKDVAKNDEVAQNPNPRANENLKDKTDEHKNTDKVGSEVTDGEAG